MQKIERGLMEQTQFSGGSSKGGSSSATAESSINLNLSGVTIPEGSKVKIDINNSASATARS
jgi:hypothetical protein